MKQKVVVIQDASRSVSSSAIKWAIEGLSLKPGDELTLLGVLHQVNTPSTFSFTGAGKFSKNSIFFFFSDKHFLNSGRKVKMIIIYCSPYFSFAFLGFQWDTKAG